MIWYRAERIIDTEQMELLLGDDITEKGVKDFWESDEHTYPTPSHLLNLDHHKLIKKAFKYTTPIPYEASKKLRFKPAGTFAIGLYASENFETAIRERLNSVVRLSGDLNIQIYTYSLSFVEGAEKNIIDIDAESEENKKVLYHDTDYISCNALFKGLAIDDKSRPKFNVVKYTSLRNSNCINNLVYDIELLNQSVGNITLYNVTKKGNTIKITDVMGALLFSYSI